MWHCIFTDLRTPSLLLHLHRRHMERGGIAGKGLPRLQPTPHGTWWDGLSCDTVGASLKVNQIATSGAIFWFSPPSPSSLTGSLWLRRRGGYHCCCGCQATGFVSGGEWLHFALLESGAAHNRHDAMSRGPGCHLRWLGLPVSGALTAALAALVFPRFLES